MKILDNNFIKLKISSQSLGIMCIFASYIFIFSEWLFFVTKPSFMSVLSIFEKVKVFLGFGSLLAIAALLAITPVLLLNTLPILKEKKHYLSLFTALLPAAILASLLLLLVDNFTYTLFSFGVFNTSELIRAIYGLLFLFAIFIIWGEVIKLAYKTSNQLNRVSDRKQKVIMFSLLILLIIPVVFIFTDDSFNKNFDQSINAESRIKLPNIILFSVEGLNASHLSIFGYERDTTPFLGEIAEVSLIAEKNFTNSTKTAGSITSMLTGKYPTTTRVLFPPDILRAEDSYQHLPGILRNAGYYAAQFGYKYYVHAYQINMLNAFDEVNNRSFKENPVYAQISSVLPTNYAFFTYEVGNHLVDRLRHIFFIEDMQNPFEQVTAKGPQKFHDAEKIENTLNLLDGLNQPLFVHIHWMGTHGLKFHPEEQIFSAGKDLNDQKNWDREFYDDAILEFDKAISGLMDELVLRKLDKNTVIIVTSDHGQAWTDRRLPLIIKFPEGSYSKHIGSNVQNLDIAPTILDYLGISIPDWMSGQSLISESYQSYPVISVGVTQKHLEPDPSGRNPPFYQFDKISVIDCQNIYGLNLETFDWEVNEFKDHSSKCSEEDLLSPEQIKNIIVKRLTKDGFQVPEIFPPKIND